MNKPYLGKNVVDSVKIGSYWYYAKKWEGEARNFVGEYTVHRLGWGSDYFEWDSFSVAQQELLKTTLEK